MKLLIFLGNDPESTNAERLLSKAAPQFPELEIERHPIDSAEARRHNLTRAPALLLDGEKICEGASPSYGEFLAKLSGHRKPASRVLGEPPTEREETFE